MTLLFITTHLILTDIFLPGGVSVLWIITFFGLLLMTVGVFIYDHLKADWKDLETEEETKPITKECVCYEKQALEELSSYKFSKDFQNKITKKLKEKRL